MKKIIAVILFLSITTQTSLFCADTDDLGGEGSSTTGTSDFASPKEGVGEELIPEEDRTKLVTPMRNLFKTVDWGIFMKEFEISAKTGFCGKGLDRAIGFKAHMVEPIGYFETTKKPLFFPFAKLDLGGKIIRSGTSRIGSDDEAGRDAFTWSHFIYFPIFGSIFKKKMPIFCFSEGDLGLPLINEFNPLYPRDTAFKNLLGPMLLLFTPQGLLSTALNCIATETAGIIRGDHKAKGDPMKDSSKTLQKKNTQEGEIEGKGIQYANFVRNSMFFSLGCDGFTPVGGYVPGQDPAMDSELLMYQAIGILHGASAMSPKPFLYKQTNFSAMTWKKASENIADTMCSPAKYALPVESQYIVQRVYPTVGSVHEFGETPATSSSASNVPGSKDNYVNIVWERRDYYAFAYLCPGKQTTVPADGGK